MRTVADAEGRRYLLRKQSREAWLVRDPETGEEHHLPASTLSVVDGESPLETAARGVPDSVERDLDLPGERAFGLLAEIRQRGPVGVRALLESYDLCESDLHGLLGEFVAAGLVVETHFAGERGYEPTEALRAVWPRD